MDIQSLTKKQISLINNGHALHTGIALTIFFLYKYNKQILKDDLKTIFSYYKDSYEYAPVHQKATSEVISIREDVVVKEEEIDDQNDSKDEGDMFKFETEEDECIPNGNKLSVAER